VSDEEARLRPWVPDGVDDEPWWLAFVADGGRVQVATPKTLLTDAMVRVTATPRDGSAIQTDFRADLIPRLNTLVIPRLNALGMLAHAPGWDAPPRWGLKFEGDWPAAWPRLWAEPLMVALDDQWLDWAETERLAGRLDALPIVPPDLEVPEEQGSLFRLPRVARLGVPTALWTQIISTGLANAAQGKGAIVDLEHEGSALVVEAGTWGAMRLVPAAPPRTAELTQRFPGIEKTEADELAGTLRKDGPLMSALVGFAGVQFTASHPWQWVAWDDRFRRTFGWKPPGSRRGEDREASLVKSRRDFDRLLYSRLRLGERVYLLGALTAVEKQRGETHEAGTYFMGDVVLDAATGLPLRVRWDPVGVSLEKVGGGGSEELGCLSDIFALPDSGPGRLATRYIVDLLFGWQRLVNEPGECWAEARADGTPGLRFKTVTRKLILGADMVHTPEGVRYTFTRPPDGKQAPGELLNSPTHVTRAMDYDEKAIDLLIRAKLLDSWTDEWQGEGEPPWPSPAAKRRARRYYDGDWIWDWLRVPADARPGDKVLPELFELRDNRAKRLNTGSE
jgi:hypothetical protein